jgi:hypothetical protein
MSKGFDDLESASSHDGQVLRLVGFSQKSWTPPPDIDMFEVGFVRIFTRTYSQASAPKTTQYKFFEANVSVVLLVRSRRRLFQRQPRPCCTWIPRLTSICSAIACHGSRHPPMAYEDGSAIANPRLNNTSAARYRMWGKHYQFKSGLTIWTVYRPKGRTHEEI